ncbi:MAG: hypothetical protein COZ37_01225 [bacterium (Candidatus Ratteibacteria) CG_4_10_14_3_um_filter_41_18]|uniref:Uncharacterized protein n=3 Tax=Candidatus Ratteibacteria TaxID=2979319 RepID=A0A2M7E7B3_9BACT|nr:MAG: hypothetical protein COS11_06405 [bacterium (Candidatus Ratteibacteria) CG01_land_8_20_14_3_00_40_19]PIX77714.1 MAG: hypothetical protein COZ37_01225 [bacterium (Candidatus Ratteibacteria) CG_4_10_14_3_um_filter_41_18]PJA61539.1 MAG: hypothetical protein CO162_05765 [bacterium (Candidatus Ratteibacteria) CG_4_9_14_3_um_filter_41_21]
MPILIFTITDLFYHRFKTIDKNNLLSLSMTYIIKKKGGRMAKKKVAKKKAAKKKKVCCK